MMAEQVKLDTFDPPHLKLQTSTQNKLDALHKECEKQFAKDETCIGMISLAKMTIETENSDPVSQKPYPISMKNYQWVTKEIEKLLAAKSSVAADPVGQHL